MPDDMCQTTEWTGWSECSTTCGKGYELRTRRFLNRMGRKKCPHVDTTERRSCAGTEATCPGGDRPEAETRVLANPDCAVTSWSDWSPCSVSCGKPEIYRLRPWRSRLVPHTTYSTNNMGQKCEGNCGLWVPNEIIQKTYPENLKKIKNGCRLGVTC